MKNADIELIKKKFQISGTIIIVEYTPYKNKKICRLILMLLDNGSIRICEKKEGVWIVHQWIKKQFYFHLKFMIILL